MVTLSESAVFLFSYKLLEQVRKNFNSKGVKSVLLVAIIPMHIQNWDIIKINKDKVSFPEIEGKVVSFKTSNSIQSIGQIEKSRNFTSASWSWKADTFPLVSTRRFTKQNDDFAIRVSFLISGGRENLSLPTLIDKKRKKIKAAYVVSYVGVNYTTANGQCSICPYSKYIIYCPVKISKKWSSVSMNPIIDLHKTIGGTKKEKSYISGTWLMSDSDNTKNSTKSDLRSLVLSNKRNESSL